ncbi:MAG: cupin domain-containing protein [Kofleriaceae bacterium]
MTRRHPHVVHLAEVAVVDDPHGTFAPRERYLAEAAGGRQLGCSHVVLAPGCKAYPFHYHCANEEAIYVLAGTGIARIGDQRIEIRAGDYLAFPVGQATAHQTINTGSVPLEYLCLSTQHATEVVGYPDSGKLGASHYEVNADNSLRAVVRERFFERDAVDYWEDEPDS